MIDPRNHQTRAPHTPESLAHDKHWLCHVCIIPNHHSRERCHKCQRPRVKPTEAR